MILPLYLVFSFEGVVFALYMYYRKKLEKLGCIISYHNITHPSIAPEADSDLLTALFDFFEDFFVGVKNTFSSSSNNVL